MEDRIPRIAIGRSFEWNNHTSRPFNRTAAVDFGNGLSPTTKSEMKFNNGTVINSRKELQWFFQLHAYLFGCMFFILAFYTFSSVLNIRSQISKRRFMSGINTFLCIFGLSRAASLVIDPYGFSKVLPTPIVNVLWSIGIPSLTSAFCLLQLAVLHLTKLKIGPTVLRTEIFLRTVITLHMFISVLTAIISTLHRSQTIAVADLTCEVTFLLWSTFVYGSFLFIGYKISGHLDRVPITMLQNNQNRGIMQMVMLAPQSNLATSVTAALMPTIMKSMQKPLATETINPIIPTVVKNENKRCVPSASSPSVNRGNMRPGNLGMNSVKNPTSVNPDPELGEGASKMKKLKWQSSITNGNKSIDGDINSKKNYKPILKECNKPEIKINDADEDPKELTKLKNDDKSIEPHQNNDEPTTGGGSAVENDLLLQSILNHIAYVNRANPKASFKRDGPAPPPTSKKSQVRIVLRITYSTAVLGVFLSLLQLFEKVGPYGLLGSILNIKVINTFYWITFQTVCRICEILIASCIANVTKQPSSSVHRYYKHNPSVMIKQRESMFM